MSCRVSKGRRTTNGRRSLKLRLFGFKQSCFPQAVKKEIELGYNVFCAGGIVNSCCRCDGSRRTSRALRTGLAPWDLLGPGGLVGRLLPVDLLLPSHPVVPEAQLLPFHLSDPVAPAVL